MSDGIESVIVGTYPSGAVTRLEEAHDTFTAERVVIAQLVAHVCKGGVVGRLFEHAFLKQPEPDVAEIVFNNRLHLSACKVDLIAVIGVVV